ncbi:CHAT domain-containing protein [Aliterella atlantica]|uniref:CHAT domain-containing protein n=1 Tax=Aliterella atlantica TaxID=1827278 RepID=UPI0006989EC6|nr:CHAT domain-containing protein [Aliterella atlantica]
MSKLNSLSATIILIFAGFEPPIALAQTPQYKGNAWILTRPNFAYTGGRCVVNGSFEDIQRPLYQNGNILRGGIGQNVSQLNIQDSNIQGEGFTVSDRSSGEPDPNQVGTITDTFNGSLRSDGVFAGTVTTTYYRSGDRICQTSGAFTLVRQSAADPNQTRSVTLIDRSTFETRFRSAPTEQAASLFEAQQTNAIAKHLDVPPPKPPTLREISQDLAKIEQKTQEKPALSYVVTLKDRLDLVLVLPRKDATKNSDSLPVRRITLRANAEDIQKLAQEFRQEVTNSRKTNTTSYLSSAQKLHELLIAPLEPELQANKVKTLIISADNHLRSIPLAALHDGKQFLIEKYSIALIPSFAMTDTRYKDLRKTTLLAMGISKSTQEQIPLPAVAVEVSELSQQWSQSKGFLDEEFTLNKLKSLTQEQRYGIIHLATHAEFQKGERDKSFIQFWGEKLRLDKLRQYTSESGWNKNPTIEMLVLSACRTALGDEQAELGFAGLAFQAGVKTVVGSLWYVSDTASLTLMSEFYSQLKNAPTRSEALRQAQVAMLQGKVELKERQIKLSNGQSVTLPSNLSGAKLNLTHPYYWSAYTLVGNWN